MKEKIADLPTQTIAQLVRDIAKKTKKKESSKNQTFSQYCESLATKLAKPEFKDIVIRYRLD